ncbi:MULTISPECIES: bifunctional 3,4-dihydroxy-2-butanone-4-phosphate synthase/GTP cyclohydrolase II [Methylobacillus]|uniref:3,4-dihydroxy-2-butanone 4-phosphate synthase n=1 Tax=Methylobacillus flagellatus (strain ATCC 51484 / DSM 6875 / VKM B-1610 / KT) TaxID=265072 RepID=Q1GZH2_METFK|nr:MULTISPECIES: bifunctional 3,4-dihydroxy-2-butanone-4-phosphate synthase/GTP cyclohydrolase II [Methylobacillus]ABE50365.1 3,4-dihydroxy-2-butanone 4-phosphate synthase / GTP cyclohydrolase II [Methylobacillus flagellatus KT]MPS50009.1 bifunctional 3,4-dihydroxy-2-butanone-4-phosphate synthase/GTP cyclohydrolase II [Methylobacillus sp.]
MISPTIEIIEEMRQGRMVILVDEEDRENEGDLVLAAQFTTAEHINFMAKHGRGLICLTLTEERCKQLNLPAMVQKNGSGMGTNFTVSIEAATGVTTGISASDRARTIQAAVAPNAKPTDIVSPGHIFPVAAQNGGVLVRAGHTEAGCDLAALAGLTPASVICEILKEDGSMARLPDLIEFAKQHNLKIGTIADLIQYRNEHECLVKRAAERDVITPYGPMRLIAYADMIAKETHLALVKGEITPDKEVLVRVHEPLSVFDLIDESSRSHSWNTLQAMRKIQEAEAGIVILLHNGEGAEDLVERIKFADEPVRIRQDLRNYGIGSQILLDLGVRKMKLLAAPRKMPSIVGFGLEITGYVEAP